jgi:hypothetical protein
MRRFSRRKQILIGLCAVCVVAVGLPALREALARGDTPARARAQLAAARKERAMHTASLVRLERELSRVVSERPPSALPAQVMSRLDARARAEGITLREVRPLPERPLEGATGVPLQFSFTAPFPQAARFLTRLRTHPEGLAVERVLIAATSSDSNLVSVQARVMAFSADGMRDRLTSPTSASRPSGGGNGRG